MFPYFRLLRALNGVVLIVIIYRKFDLNSQSDNVVFALSNGGLRLCLGQIIATDGALTVSKKRKCLAGRHV